jgi:hypothetical protein
MAKILSDAKKQEVLALARLGWTLRRIEAATDVRRETAGIYVKAAGLTVRPPGRWGHPPAPPTRPGATDPAPPATEGSPDLGAPQPDGAELAAEPPAGSRAPTASACEPYRELIELALGRGRNAMGIWPCRRKDHTPLRRVNVSSAYSLWPVFRCPRMAGFGCPPRGQGTPQALQQAAELYRGDLLEGLGVSTPPFEEWLTGERERLRDLALEGLARLLGHQTAADEPLAVETARRLLVLDPLQEAVHRALMRVYARHGRRDAALRQYQSCLDTLRRELGIEPEAETRQLYQEVLRGRATPSARARSALAGLAAPASGPPRRPPPPLSDDTPMVGREAEFTRLVGALDEAGAGPGQLIALLGEGGIGKSRLVSQLGVEAAKRDVLRLVGRAYPTERELAYGPWIEALQTGGVLHRDDVLAHLAPAWRAELARLFPELATLDDQRAPSSEDAMRLFEGVAHLLERLARTCPLLVVLEDVHWADEMSVRLSSVLSRRIAACQILIVLTAREEDVAEAPVLRDLLGMPSLERLRLGPLSHGETMALAQSLGPRGRNEEGEGELRERLWAASGGNPFVIVETLRAVEQGATPRIHEPLPLPERVSELVRARLDRLSERGRALAGLAAAIGREFEFNLLQRASGLGEDEAAAGVEELVRRRVLRAIDEQLAFVHDRVREVAHAGLLPFRRKLLHRQVAETLEALHAADLDPQIGSPVRCRSLRRGRTCLARCARTWPFRARSTS